MQITKTALILNWRTLLRFLVFFCIAPVFLADLYKLFAHRNEFPNVGCYEACIVSAIAVV